jgi:hypothetical protein
VIAAIDQIRQGQYVAIVVIGAAIGGKSQRGNAEPGLP